MTPPPDLPQDGLRDIVVSNPQFLADAFKYIVSVSRLKLIPEGKLSRLQLSELWRSIPSSAHEFLEGVMVKFGIFFEWKKGPNPLLKLIRAKHVVESKCL